MSSRNAASCPSFAHATTCRSLAACRWLGLSFAPMTPSPAAEVLSPSGGEAKRSYVRRLFTAIAPRYDFLNHLLSLNVDRAWRRAAVARLGWEARPDGVYLDLCAGTLDLAATLARAPGFRGRVVGADFVVPMLAGGRGKAPRRPAARGRLQGRCVRTAHRRDLRHPSWNSIVCESSSPPSTRAATWRASSVPSPSTKKSPRSPTAA